MLNRFDRFREGIIDFRQKHGWVAVFVAVGIASPVVPAVGWFYQRQIDTQGAVIMAQEALIACLERAFDGQPGVGNTSTCNAGSILRQAVRQRAQPGPQVARREDIPRPQAPQPSDLASVDRATRSGDLLEPTRKDNHEFMVWGSIGSRTSQAGAAWWLGIHEQGRLFPLLAIDPGDADSAGHFEHHLNVPAPLHRGQFVLLEVGPLGAVLFERRAAEGLYKIPLLVGALPDVRQSYQVSAQEIIGGEEK